MPAAVPVSVPATESVIEVDKVATRFGEHGGKPTSASALAVRRSSR